MSGTQRLQLAADLNKDQWLQIGRKLAAEHGRIQWALGDWWAYGIARNYGDGPALAQEVGVDYALLRNYAWVSRAVELSSRNDKLSWSHHAAVAPLQPQEQKRWLQIAALERLSVTALRQRIDPDHKPLQGLFYEPKTVEWWTPRQYIKLAVEVMGGIDLDPASCSEANKIVGAARSYDMQANGLHQPWFGRVWLNPPYAQSAGQFVKKLLAEKACGNVNQAIVLLNTNTLDRGWFNPLWDAVLCFHRGQVKFTSPDVEHGKDQQRDQSAHGERFRLFR
jgi:hypothetical protein